MKEILIFRSSVFSRSLKKKKSVPGQYRDTYRIVGLLSIHTLNIGTTFVIASLSRCLVQGPVP